MRTLLIAALLTAACSKSSPGTVANKAGSPGGADYSATIADPLGFLPVDSEVVMALDANRLRATPLYQRLAPDMLSRIGGALDELNQMCGFDMLGSIRGISVGLSQVGSDNPTGVAVVSGLPRDKSMACIDTANQKKPGQFTRDGDVVFQQASSGKVAFMFVDASTAVTYMGPDVSKQRLMTVLAGGAPLRKSPAFMEMFGLVKADDPIWFFVNGNAKFMQEMAAMGVRPKAMFGSLAVDSGLAATMRVRLDSNQSAQSLAQMAQSQTQMASGFFEKLEFTADGNDTVLSASMTQAQLDNLLAMVGSMLGGP